MTREEAQRRVDEWRLVEGTEVWRELIKGMEDVGRVYNKVLADSLEEKKMYRAQGALKVVRAVLHARENQLREAAEVLTGKTRTTA